MDPTLSAPSHDDFQQFLDMGMNNLGDSLHFDVPDFNNQQAQGARLMQQEGGERMESRMDGAHGAMSHDTPMQEHLPAMTTPGSHPTIPGPTSNGQSSSGSIVEIDAQIQYLQQQRQQRQMQEQQKYYARNGMIPPTPNSIELHGNNGQFYPQSDPQQQAMYERFRMQAKDQEVRALVTFEWLHN
jgi:hypothetical protein